MTIHFDEDKQNLRLKLLRLEEEEKSVQLVSEKYGLPYIDLTRVPINTDGLRLIPEQEARDNTMAVFDIIGKRISIAIHSPGYAPTIQSIRNLQQKGYETAVFLASKHSIEKAWDRYKDLSFAFETEAGSLDISNDEIEQLIEKTKKLGDISTLIEEALSIKKSHKVSRLIAIIMAGGLSTKASDIHIEAEVDSARVRYRLDGVLIEVIKFDMDTYRLLLSRIKLLSGLKLNIKEMAQDGRFTVKIYMSDIEIRTSTVPGSYGESIVMRILNPKSISTPMEELGFPERLLKILNTEIARPNGLILTTGPTGSGKTTTLYAFLRSVQSPEMKIITIEDPIEYHLPGIVQTQVEERKNYNFESGLRAALRQDPDVIMVGEIRDGETASTAIQASLTGHLVFSTLHTNNAAGTFTRLVDLGVDPKVLTSAIRVAMAQRLVRKLCNDCKKKGPIPPERQALADELYNSLDGYEEIKYFPTKPTEAYSAVGCEKCNNTGYKGRIGVYEAILADKNIEFIVRENPSEREIRQAAASQRILTMKQDGLIKVFQGITSFDELERVVDIAEEIATVPKEEIPPVYNPEDAFKEIPTEPTPEPVKEEKLVSVPSYTTDEQSVEISAPELNTPSV
ncbi:MAG: type II/IV secretion system protein [Candidatus Taylorbacteria bacterium]|nr:type II/IV secretion system protein [Candidatus Taylorbacteria bacterium]